MGKGHLWLEHTGFCYIAIEHTPFIVDLPIQNGEFLKLFVCLPEGSGFYGDFMRKKLPLNGGLSIATFDSGRVIHRIVKLA